VRRIVWLNFDPLFKLSLALLEARRYWTIRGWVIVARSSKASIFHLHLGQLSKVGSVDDGLAQRKGQVPHYRTDEIEKHFGSVVAAGQRK
jgi:hypothetical protein